MIRNVVFDFGQVLINFQPETYLRMLFPHSHQIDGLKKAIFGSAEWIMLDRGVIDQPEAELRLINQHPSFQDEISVALAHWFSMLTPIEANVELLPQLKKDGYGLYAISNFHEAAFAYILEQYGWLSLFDGMVISFQHRLLKPEPQIYRQLLTGHGLRGEECLFIDDVPANVEGARRVGMDAILYESPSQLRRELSKRL